jgi:beta-N-acetylglucosaminidase
MTEGEMIATYGNYSRSITETYKGTEADLNKFLSDKGVLKGKAKTFIAAAKKYNISAAALAAICVHESGRGTSSLAVKKNNIGGIRPKGDNKNFRTFSSIDECIEFIAKLLRNNYANIGLTKLYQVNAKYCPVLTEADINGTNGLWARQVNYFLEQIDKVHA